MITLRLIRTAAVAGMTLLAVPAFASTAFAADAPARAAHFEAVAGHAGVLRTKSDYGMDETITRLKADIAAKGIRFFDAIDQTALAAGAKITIGPSVLLVFGNPPLGTQFISSSPYAGLDWPVRLLVFQDKTGQVWLAYHDFAAIAASHHITDRKAQFAMAASVVASIAAAAQKP